MGGVEINGLVDGTKVRQDVGGIAQRSYTSPGTLLGCRPNAMEFSLCRENSNMDSFKIFQAACIKVEFVVYRSKRSEIWNYFARRCALWMHGGPHFM